MRWDAARAASRRELPKPRKMHGPVGEQPNIDWGGGTVDLTHICCGMIICNCKPVERMFEGNRTIWCMCCGRAYDVTPLGTPRERCDNCDTSGSWWTRTRPGSVDVAGLEKLRAEWFTEYHLRKAAEREF